MKRLFIMALAVATLTACEKEIITEEEDETVSDGSAIEKTKKFTFTVKGDFTDEWKPVTRGYLSADGKDMTDLWVMDYVGGQLVQQIHQSDNTAEDFGRPVMNLSYGTHHVYFVASRGSSPVLNTTDGTITWSSVRDTFWKDYEVSVVSTSNGNRAVTLANGMVISEYNVQMLRRFKSVGDEPVCRFEFAYAITCHKAQGSEFDCVVVFDESWAFGEEWNRWLYTAITRAKEKLLIIR